MAELVDQKYPEQIARLRENYGFTQTHANALVMYSRGSNSSKRFATPAKYFQSLDPAQAKTIKTIFSAITKKYPELKLVIAWNQPMLTFGKHYVFGVSAAKKHISFAPWSTDVIEKFTAKGIQLKSGKHLEADIVISATGLEIQILGGVQGSIDGKPMNTSKHMLYQGVMVSDVPNMAMIIGYINASWTLKVDIAADYICRLINHMDKNGFDEVIAHADPLQREDDTIMGKMSSGYIARAADVMPKQGKQAPWKITNNYLADRKELKDAKFNDEVLQFQKRGDQTDRKPKLVS